MAKQKINNSQTNFANDYSTNEVDTGRKWHDGRTIYRKCITGTVNLAVGTISIAHGITGASNIGLVRIGGYIRFGNSNDDGVCIALPVYVESSSVLFGLMVINSTNITGYATYAWGNSFYNIVLEYVK